MDIMVSFLIIDYGENYIVKKIYSGELLFSLSLNKLKWNIDSITILNEMKCSEH